MKDACELARALRLLCLGAEEQPSSERDSGAASLHIRRMGFTAYHKLDAPGRETASRNVVCDVPRLPCRRGPATGGPALAGAG